MKKILGSKPKEVYTSKKGASKSCGSKAGMKKK